jgi:hypothetical protein
MGIFSFEAAMADQAVNLINMSASQSSDTLSNILNDLAPINDGAWIGLGAEEFKQDAYRLIGGLATLISDINATGGLAREVAEDIHAVDNFLSSLFGFVEDVFDAITPW